MYTELIKTISTNDHIEQTPKTCSMCSVKLNDESNNDHHLCKDCKILHHLVKCRFCRSEFYQERNSKKRETTCKKCEQLIEEHGKPKACTYCNIIAAFIGSKCQRCANSEKKYGPPVTCETCKQKSAFNRNEPDCKKKVDGKLLCWLCTISYKRSLARAKLKESLVSSGQHRSSSSKDKSHHHHHHHHHRNRSSKEDRTLDHHSSSTREHSAIYKDTSQNPFSRQSHNQSQSLMNNSEQSKKRRHDSSEYQNSTLPTTNNFGTIGAAPISSTIALNSTSSFVDPKFNDSAANDMALLVTQLKEQVANLNKKLQQKDRELLSKDMQITELKATNAREQRDLREKITNLQKESDSRCNDLQSKLISMQKQYISVTKAKKAPVINRETIEIPSII